MPLIVPPELEQRVTALAQEASRDPQEMLADLLNEALGDDAAFRTAVREGVAQLDRGEGIPHEQVMADLREILGQHSRPQ
jgi:predicted transcriptional regulator